MVKCQELVYANKMRGKYSDLIPMKIQSDLRLKIGRI